MPRGIYHSVLLLLALVSSISLYIRFRGLGNVGTYHAGLRRGGGSGDEQGNQSGSKHQLRSALDIDVHTVSTWKCHNKPQVASNVSHLDHYYGTHTDVLLRDINAWFETRSLSGFILGSYQFGNGTLIEIFENDRNKLTGIIRQCGYPRNQVSTKYEYENCDSYPLWKNLTHVYPALPDVLHLYNSTVEPKSPVFHNDDNSEGTLVALTISDQLPTTVACLVNLDKAVRDANAHLMIIDDHSADSSVDYLRQRGYFVVTRAQSSGLSESWNIAYSFASSKNYAYLFLVNNDVLVYSEAIILMRSILQMEAIVGPTTSRRGAGNNHQQSLLEAISTSKNLPNKLKVFESYVRNPRNSYRLQQALQSHFKKKSTPLNRPFRFNGFFFGCNMTFLENIAFDPGKKLIDDLKYPMVGQETYLTEKLKEYNAIMMNNISALYNESSSLGKTKSKPFQYRELFPRLALGAFAFHFKSVTIQVALNNLGSNCSIRGSAGEDIRSDYHIYHPVNRTHYTTHFSRFVHGNRFDDVSVSSLRSDILLYPALKESSQKKIIISMIVSDPVKTPSAGDLLTASELASALQTVYPQQFQVQYLHQGVTWYDADLLAQTDVLIVLLDTFNLGTALQTRQKSSKDTMYSLAFGPPHGVKKNLICIAWARNWFHRWVSRPWIGNYDFIYVSSHTAVRIYESINSNIGFPTQCLHSCPEMQPKLQSSFGRRRTVSGFRRKVPTELLLLATNISRFQCGILSRLNSTRSEYLIPMSYYHQKRAIMSINPLSLMPYRGKLLGKGWDDAPNDSFVAGVYKNSLWEGFVPYHKLANEYAQSAIILDDANFVTRSWGSVNSKVFDALGCGRLVITNGIVGSTQVFKGRLPYWNNSADSITSTKRLKNVLDSFFEPNPDVFGNMVPNSLYNDTLLHLQNDIRLNHSYLMRAKQIGSDFVNNFGMRLVAGESKSPLTNSPDQYIRREYHHEVCIGVRTFSTQYPHLLKMLCALVKQFSAYETEFDTLNGNRISRSKRNARARVSLRIFVVETQNHSENTRLQLQREVIDKLNGDITSDGVNIHVMYDPLLESTIKSQSNERCSPMGLKLDSKFRNVSEYRPNQLYGYEETDMLLTHILRMREEKHLPVCNWLTFTNGDNDYDKNWFRTIAKTISKSSIQKSDDTHIVNEYTTSSGHVRALQMIAWNFQSHHPRNTSRGIMLRNQLIQTDLDKRGFVDLASFIVNVDLLLEVKPLFIHNSIFTKDAFALDYFYAKSLRQKLDKQDIQGRNGTLYIRECLLFHH